MSISARTHRLIDSRRCARGRTPSLVALLAAGLVSACATGGQAGQRPSQQATDLRQGGYGRWTLGCNFASVGVSETIEEWGEGNVDQSGPMPQFTMAYGGYVVPGLALHVDMALALEFDTRHHNYPIRRSGNTIFTYLGFGATYYVYPDDWFASLSLGLASSSVFVLKNDLSGDESFDGLGLGVHALVGKEWHVDRAIGLGVALDVVIAPTWSDEWTDDDVDPFLWSVGVAVVLSR